MKRTKRVFVSYSKTDTDWAKKFAAALKNQGVRVWADILDSKAGDSVIAKMERSLRESDVLVAVIGSHIPITPNLYFEIGAALGMGKRLVPVIPDDADQSRLAFLKRSKECLVRKSPESTATELAEALKAA